LAVLVVPLAIPELLLTQSIVVVLKGQPVPKVPYQAPVLLVVFRVPKVH
jgi:hypothetical protein